MILSHCRAITQNTFVEINVTEKKQKKKSTQQLSLSPTRPRQYPTWKRKRIRIEQEGRASSVKSPFGLLSFQISSHICPGRFSSGNEPNLNKDQMLIPAKALSLKGDGRHSSPLAHVGTCQRGENRELAASEDGTKLDSIFWADLDVRAPWMRTHFERGNLHTTALY